MKNKTRYAIYWKHITWSFLSIKLYCSHILYESCEKDWCKITTFRKYSKLVCSPAKSHWASQITLLININTNENFEMCLITRLEQIMFQGVFSMCCLTYWSYDGGARVHFKEHQWMVITRDLKESQKQTIQGTSVFI